MKSATKRIPRPLQVIHGERASLMDVLLVYGVGVFYKIFIPFIIGGLVLQILLHLWRIVVNR